MTVSHAEPGGHGSGLRVPHAHPPRSGGRSGREQRTSRVLWLAYSWDMARARVVRLDPTATDLGTASVDGWAATGSDRHILAAPDPHGVLWGRVWRIDRRAAAVLGGRRFPHGLQESVLARDAQGRELDVEVLTGGRPPRTGRPALDELGWALHGAAEAGLEQAQRRLLRRMLLGGRARHPAQKEPS